MPIACDIVACGRYYEFILSQLSVIGAAKVSHFEVLCRAHGLFEPTVGLFRCLYVNSKNKGWMSFSKRPGNDAVCYTKPLDSLKNWNDQMDLLSFIYIADPIKVRIGERQRGEEEPKLLDTIVGRTVPLLLVTPAHAESELDASVDRLFDEGGSGTQAEQGDSAGGGDEQDIIIQPVIIVVNTAAEDVIPLQPRRLKKRKTIVSDAGGSSHPPKKNYGWIHGNLSGRNPWV
ncbi:hypothetical protein Tco_0066382 [Tanacetum coccineum]